MLQLSFFCILFLFNCVFLILFSFLAILLSTNFELSLVWKKSHSVQPYKLWMYLLLSFTGHCGVPQHTHTGSLTRLEIFQVSPIHCSAEILNSVSMWGV